MNTNGNVRVQPGQIWPTGIFTLSGQEAQATALKAPYSLLSEDRDSQAYHRAIQDFADTWLVRAQDAIGRLIVDYQDYRCAIGLPVRSFDEGLFEALVLGVLLREHGAEADGLSRIGGRLLAELAALQDRHPWAKRPIKALRGLINGLSQHSGILKIEDDGVGQLIDWLRAQGEFAQADRLAEWQSYFESVGVYQTREIVLQCLALANDFDVASIAALGQYTVDVGHFLAHVTPSARWRYDSALVTRSRIEYHLAMLGSEVLTRAYRGQFLATHRKMVVLPDCMRAQPDGTCQAVKTSLGGQCQACTPGCPARKVKALGKVYGFEVYILPDEFRQVGVEACSAEENVGVVGVSCALTNWDAGWQLEAAGVPTQGVLLDCAGCQKHWGAWGQLPTTVDQERLLSILGILDRNGGEELDESGEPTHAMSVPICGLCEVS